MNICVIGGAGYVGLITGLGLAEIGHQVTNVDVDQIRIHQLQNGTLPIYEEGIELVLRRNMNAERLRFSTDLDAAVAPSQVVIIAVGTPSLQNGQADLSHVIKVIEDLARCLNGYKVLAFKSTVPVGTVEIIRNTLTRDKEEGIDFDIVANPEFLREGKGLYDFFYPDRIVIGTSSEEAKAIMRDVYDPIINRRIPGMENMAAPPSTGPVPVIETGLVSAQMIKYASNAFLASRISFVNEVAGLCENVGADIQEVIRGMGYDPRIGHGYLTPGLGFGGPCLEKDLRALIGLGESDGHEPHLLRAVLKRNERQVSEVVAKLKHLVGYPLHQKTVAVYGLAFKAGTNDVRNSLALKVIDNLTKEGAIVQAHDPVVSLQAESLKSHMACYDDPYRAAQDADALMILTEWPSFNDLDYKKIKAIMACPLIVDGRNLLDASAIRKLGFTYVGIGLP